MPRRISGGVVPSVGPGLRNGRTASRSPGGDATADDLEELIECMCAPIGAPSALRSDPRDLSVPNVGSGVLDVAN